MAKKAAAEAAAETKSTLATVKAAGGALAAAKPAYLADVDHGGANALLAQYVRPMRMKVVQKQARAELLDLFNVGDVIIGGQNVLIAPVPLNDKGKPEKVGTPFHVVPLYMFPEWVCFNPIEVTSLFAVRERSLDAGSALAAKSREEATRKFACPEDPRFMCSISEVLNFVVMVMDPDNEAFGIPMVLPFLRGTYKHGANWASLIQMRKAPMYACQFQVQTKWEPNDKGDWYSPVPSNPGDVSPWVDDKETYDKFEQLHRDFEKSHKDRLIEVDYTDVEAADAPRTM